MKMVIVLVIGLMVISACGGSTTEAPEVTIDVQATVDAGIAEGLKVQATIDAGIAEGLKEKPMLISTPTPRPTATPTPKPIATPILEPTPTLVPKPTLTPLPIPTPTPISTTIVALEPTPTETQSYVQALAQEYSGCSGLSDLLPKLNLPLATIVQYQQVVLMGGADFCNDVIKAVNYQVNFKDEYATDLLQPTEDCRWISGCVEGQVGTQAGFGQVARLEIPMGEPVTINDLEKNMDTSTPSSVEKITKWAESGLYNNILLTGVVDQLDPMTDKETKRKRYQIIFKGDDDEEFRLRCLVPIIQHGSQMDSVMYEISSGDNTIPDRQVRVGDTLTVSGVHRVIEGQGYMLFYDPCVIRE